MPIALILLGPWDKLLEIAAKYKDVFGKGLLAFITSLVLGLAILAYALFGADNAWDFGSDGAWDFRPAGRMVRIGASLIIILCIFLFVLLLASGPAR